MQNVCAMHKPHNKGIARTRAALPDFENIIAYVFKDQQTRKIQQPANRDLYEGIRGFGFGKRVHLKRYITPDNP